jgi:aspartyl-tRNA(Asn)/glutamyl-tRNA(Gln) amidotransferase subunit C
VKSRREKADRRGPGQRGRRARGLQEPGELGLDPLGGDALEGGGGEPARPRGLAVRAKTVGREEPRGPQGPQGIVPEVSFGDHSEPATGKIADPAVGIEKRPVAHLDRHRVGGEVAAGEIRFDRTALDLRHVDRPSPPRDAEHARLALPREKHSSAASRSLHFARDGARIALHGDVHLGNPADESEVTQRSSDDPDARTETFRNPIEGGEVRLRREFSGAPPQVSGGSGIGKIGLPAYNLRMSSRPSTVTPDVVRRIAALARLRLPESELSVWSRQLDRIVSYIDQLKELPEDALPPGEPLPPTPLRADRPRPGHGDQALAENAPVLAHGFGVVPRVVGTGE